MKQLYVKAIFLAIVVALVLAVVNQALAGPWPER
jgi:hypothetical protein